MRWGVVVVVGGGVRVERMKVLVLERANLGGEGGEVSGCG